jgi:hypothetical protein
MGGALKLFGIDQVAAVDFDAAGVCPHSLGAGV